MMIRVLVAATVLTSIAAALACGDNYDDAPAPATTSTAPVATSTVAGGSGTAVAGTAIVSTAVASTPIADGTPPPPRTPAPTATSVTLPDVGTGIAGIVLIGPQCPVVQEGVDCPDKPFEATIEIYVGARLITTARSGADGIFSVALDPGIYRLVPLSPGGPTFAAEQTATVTAGAATRVTINYDSGIR